MKSTFLLQKKKQLNAVNTANANPHEKAEAVKIYALTIKDDQKV